MKVEKRRNQKFKLSKTNVSLNNKNASDRLHSAALAFYSASRGLARTRWLPWKPPNSTAYRSRRTCRSPFKPLSTLCVECCCGYWRSAMCASCKLSLQLVAVQLALGKQLAVHCLPLPNSVQNCGNYLQPTRLTMSSGFCSGRLLKTVSLFHFNLRSILNKF